ncbi:MAG TPA: hypothetical protein VFH72_04430, partial [Candidatus Baltobacteraceae bacterium]|nr:hypothetical protein [Candidatus Baltobacteraceae bacterium]
MIHLILSAVLLGGAPSAADSRFTLDDVYKIVGVSSPRISPDGTTLVFTRSHVDLEHDRRDSELVLLDIRSHEQHVLKSDRTVHDAMWSPDGSQIAYLASDSDHHTQIWLTPPRDAQPLQLTHSATGVEQFAWRPDGKAIAYIASDEAPKRTGIARFQDAFRVTDNAYLDAGPFPPAHLWLVSIPQRDKAQRLTSGTWSVAAGAAESTISWSPDGKKLVYVRIPNALLGDADRSVVEILDVATHKSTPLTGRMRYEFNPRYAPDGLAVSYTYARDGDPMNQANIFLSPGHGPGFDLTKIGLDANTTNYAWYPDSKALLVEGNAGTHEALWRMLRNGHVQRLQLGEVNPLGDYDGSIARDGGIAFVGTTPHHPGEIYYRSPSGKLTRLTDYNFALASKPLGKVTTLNWTAAADVHEGRRPGAPRALRVGGVQRAARIRLFNEDGVLTYPVDYVKGKRYPLVLLIHGGPTSASTTNWDELAQLMAARGWFVLRPNYRGSDNL